MNITSTFQVGTKVSLYVKVKKDKPSKTLTAKEQEMYYDYLMENSNKLSDYLSNSQPQDDELKYAQVLNDTPDMPVRNIERNRSRSEQKL